MYEQLRALIEKWLKIPPEPQDPVGEESSLRVFRASPKYYQYRMWFWRLSLVPGILFWLVLIIGLPALLIAISGPVAAILIPIALLLGLFLLAIAVFQVMYSWVALRLDYEYRWYKVTDRSLRIREGIFHVREMTMTFSNIQNISLTQGPIQRMFGIADLKVETAGGGVSSDQQPTVGLDMHVGYFRGVDNAPEIRDLMMMRLKHYRGAGLGDGRNNDTDGDGDSDFHRKTAGQWSPEAVEALHVIREAAKDFRQTAERLSVPSSDGS